MYILNNLDRDVIIYDIRFSRFVTRNSILIAKIYRFDFVCVIFLLLLTIFDIVN